MDSSYRNEPKNDRVEVIKLPATGSSSNGNFSASKQTPEKDWNYESLNLSSKGNSFTSNDADDAPLNLSLKSSAAPKSSTPGVDDNVLDLIVHKNSGKSSESAVNNLSNLQNLTANIGSLTGDSKGEFQRNK
jgi:hypothetical protein